MSSRELAGYRQGAWGLFGSPDTDPPWVAWIHDTAEGWRREVIRLREAGRAAGLQITPLRSGTASDVSLPGALQTTAATPALWATQVQLTRDITTAIGQLARAMNLPIPSLGPWAEGLLYRDHGPSPWEGWGYRDAGVWRVSLLDRIRRADSEVASALARGQVSFEQLAHRVGLATDGTVNVQFLTGLAPTVLSGHEADYHQSDCGVVGAAPSGWSCVDWAVWSPGLLSPETLTLLSAILPLGWQWELAREVADTLERLGSVDALMTASRAWVALRNAMAINYMQRVLHLPVSEPEDVLILQARDQARRYEVPEGVDLFGRLVGTAASAISDPLAQKLVTVGATVPALLFELFGQAQSYATDVWGQRDPSPLLTTLTGSIDLRWVRAPEHSVATPPSSTTTRSRTVPSRTNVQRDASVRNVRTQSQLDRVTGSSRSAKKASSLAAPAAIALFALLAR